MFNLINISGFIALITSIIGLLPQLFKAIKTQSTKDISSVMLWNFTICSMAWIIYGIATDALFVWASNVLGLMVSILLIYVKYHYDVIAHNALAPEQ